MPAVIQMFSFAVLPSAILYVIVRKALDHKAWFVTVGIAMTYAFAVDTLMSQSVWLFQEGTSLGFLGYLPFEEYLSLFFLPSLTVFTYLLFTSLAARLRRPRTDV